MVCFRGIHHYPIWRDRMTGLRIVVGAALAFFVGVGLWRHDPGLLAVAVVLLVPWGVTELDARRARRDHAPPGRDGA